MSNKKNVPKRTKPYLTGAVTDEYTLRNALKFFFMLLLIMFMTFLVCSMTGFQSAVLRIVVNTAVELLVLTVLYSKGADLGEEAVARGEILYQHEQKGVSISKNERMIPYHPAKGFVTGIIGSSILIICAVLLAATAEKQMTGAGVLPSWTDAFMRRTEFRDAVVQYAQPVSAGFTDFLRIAVRIMMMPFISLAGSENKDLLLLFEKLSPLFVLLPAFAYGAGYMQGPARRSRIHTEIAENARKRKVREKRARKARIPKGPQQLN